MAAINFVAIRNNIKAAVFDSEYGSLIFYEEHMLGEICRCGSISVVAAAYCRGWCVPYSGQCIPAGVSTTERGCCLTEQGRVDFDRLLESVRPAALIRRG